MSMAASTFCLSTRNAAPNIPRRSANFHPSIWGDRFLQYASQSMEADDTMMEKITILKEEVRKMLLPATEKPLTKLNLVDSIQRLGLYYHFEREIDEVLQEIHKNFVDNGIITLDEDLHSLALLFRLLRQQGYRISPDVFHKFQDVDGNFSERLTMDVEGMLSLYEVAHLRVREEDILDEALAFTSTHLESLTHQLSPSLVSKVNHSIRHPLRKSMPRLEAWHYISTYQEDSGHDETLLTLAKLDFNIVQKLHQKEVADIFKWWKDLDFATKLPFARNRMVESYFWISGVYFEPCYSLTRRIMTKVICMTSALDDIYDVYGTLEELQLLTVAIERWDISCIDFLPEYMKVCYQALLDVYEEIEQEMTKEGRAFCVSYAKDEMKRLIRANFAEAKWFSSNYTPTMEEYMDVALVSSAYRLLIATSFIGMGHMATEDVFQWLANVPKIVRASTIICRLINDMVSNDREQDTGHVASALECYMNQNGTTKQDTIDEFSRQVINAWKDVNEECLDPTQVPKPLLLRVLNLSRAIHVLYKDEDSYTHSRGKTKTYIEALLLSPMPL